MDDVSLVKQGIKRELVMVFREQADPQRVMELAESDLEEIMTDN